MRALRGAAPTSTVTVEGATVTLKHQTAHDLLPVWAGEGYPADVALALRTIADHVDAQATHVVVARRLSSGSRALLAECGVSCPGRRDPDRRRARTRLAALGLGRHRHRRSRRTRAAGNQAPTHRPLLDGHPPPGPGPSTDRLNPARRTPAYRYLPDMRMQGRVTRAVLMTGMVAVVAAGCTGSPTPGPATSATPARSSAPSPGATPTSDPTHDATTPPERPSAMSTVDADGAAAAAGYAIEVLNFAAATGDRVPWDAISASTCRMCAKFAEDIATTGPDPSGTLSVSSTRSWEITPGSLYGTELTVEQAPDDDASSGSFVFSMALGHDGDWSVEAIDTSER